MAKRFELRPAAAMQRLESRRFILLLVFLLLMIVVSPLIEGMGVLEKISDLFLTVILLGGLWAVSHQRGWLMAELLLALPLLLLLWLPRHDQWTLLGPLGYGAGFLFFAILIYKILQFIFRQRKIDGEVICAAIVVYLLLGVAWSLLYNLVEINAPASFVVASASPGDTLPFLYFSFVTLTTVGYGDVLPLSRVARALANLEALVGQIYLTVLVARLVGMHISQGGPASSTATGENNHPG